MIDPVLSEAATMLVIAILTLLVLTALIGWAAYRDSARHLAEQKKGQTISPWQTGSARKSKEPRRV